jgi:hypothetical protein
MSRSITRPRVIGAVAVTLLAATAFGAGFAVADQPHMQSALGYLGQAKGELEAAVADKGGHRLKAIADVDAAITQVQEGINFAR